jgi:hypothetical protein
LPTSLHSQSESLEVGANTLSKLHAQNKVNQKRTQKDRKIVYKIIKWLHYRAKGTLTNFLTSRTEKTNKKEKISTKTYFQNCCAQYHEHSS